MIVIHPATDTDPIALAWQDYQAGRLTNTERIRLEREGWPTCRYGRRALIIDDATCLCDICVAQLVARRTDARPAIAAAAVALGLLTD